MDPKMISILAMGLTVGLGVIGPGIGMGLLFSSYINAVARQPEADSKIKPFLFIGLGIIEAFAIYALVFAFYILATQVIGK